MAVEGATEGDEDVLCGSEEAVAVEVIDCEFGPADYEEGEEDVSQTFRGVSQFVVYLLLLLKRLTERCYSRPVAVWLPECSRPGSTWL